VDFRQGNASSPLYLAAPGNLPGELELFYELGVDGVFSDNPDTAVAVWSELFEE
jgi:glycerophosphoryl diester phosphodiesterase